MTKRKLKVVWICHFANKQVQRELEIKRPIPEFDQGIEEVKRRNDIELHIVAPNSRIRRNKEFAEKNVYYHFFNSGIPLCDRYWPSFFRFDLYTNFHHNKQKVKSFINEIKPDIIHLHGIENSYYSSTIFQFINQYPTLATIQGFINFQIQSVKLRNDIKKRVKTEIKLLESLHNFGVRTEAMKKDILKYNKNAKFFWHEYFLNIPENIEVLPEYKMTYDLIFFARLTKSKGIEDLIKVTGILKHKYPKIKVAIVGGTSDTYLKRLKELSTSMGCLNNIDFLGFLSNQKDVFKILAKSKICVLPTYNDAIPGTIIESMFSKTPVISYNTGGIPDINEEKEILSLSEKGNVQDLSEKIESLLCDEAKRNTRAQEAYNYAVTRWNNKKALDDIIHAYRKILRCNN